MDEANQTEAQNLQKQRATHNSHWLEADGDPRGALIAGSKQTVNLGRHRHTHQTQWDSDWNAEIILEGFRRGEWTRHGFWAA